MSAFTRKDAPDARLAGRCVRGRTRHGTSGHNSPIAELGVPFGKARALPVPEPDGQRHLHLLLPNGSSLLFGADGARLPLAREPPPRAPSHQARLLNRSARMRGRVPSFASPTLISCTSRVAPAVSGKPYLRVGKPTRHLAFGDSLWHDPIQRRTCFLTHLPLLAGSIGVSSHTRPPESSE